MICNIGYKMFTRRSRQLAGLLPTSQRIMGLNWRKIILFRVQETPVDFQSCQCNENHIKSKQRLRFKIWKSGLNI